MTFLFLKVDIFTCKLYVTQSKYINKTETETNDVRHALGLAIVYSKKMGFCIHRSSVID